MGKPWEILQGDARQVLKTLPDNSFHGCVSDPPYGLSFMGKRWDYDVPSVGTWVELLRVLKPGAHALLFGGSRTVHRLACAVEDAGFEIRDTLHWIYGSGFPKSLDVSKAIDKAAGAKRRVVGTSRGTSSVDGGSYRGGVGTKQRGVDVPVTAPETEAAIAWDGYGTGLKPAYEPILLVRKLPEGTVADNARRWKTGGLAIDDCRIDFAGAEDEAETKAKNAHTKLGSGRRRNTVFQPDKAPARDYVAPGRWPSNLILDEESAAMLDAQVGDRPGMSGGGLHRAEYGGGMFGAVDSAGTARGDNGGPSRFFYVVKAGRFERESGLAEFDEKILGSLAGGGEGADDPVSKRFTKSARNTHPTVKPIDLIKYISALILPPKWGEPRRCIVPFSGVASEMIGAMQSGWEEVVGVEREVEYIPKAEARIRKGGVFSTLDRSTKRRGGR